MVTSMCRFHSILGLAALTALLIIEPASAEDTVEQFAVYEAAFTATGRYGNPYTELEATAEIQCPDGTTWTIPLFWDGGDAWKLRISPDLPGEWSFTVHSGDAGLDGRTSALTSTSSGRRGSIRPMQGFPQHFQYQNGEAMWFLGDTAWALFTANPDEEYDRAAAEHYLRTRADQGFNVVHSMLLSEAGWGNAGGLPFDDLAHERINPGYWREVDERLAYANGQGLVVGLAIAWADKRKQEPFAWRRFPDVKARKRYARYVAARYSAYDVYFLVSGEWHGEIRTRPAAEEVVRREFIDIGDALDAADPHGRMIGIHPMTSQGSVREFNEAEWMSFGDYQQNYRDLHARVLESRPFDKPVVNSEYGYLFRDQNGDGTPDKDNSTSLESIRHASWDIVMAGGYLVTGFGTTYFGGNRDPGPFDVDAEKNDDWERQIGVMRNLFTGCDWWRLEPHDGLLSCGTPRGNDRRDLGRTAPPAATYWCLAEPGRQYVAYMRGVERAVTLDVGETGEDCRVRQFDPRAGTFRVLELAPVNGRLEFRPPDKRDWVLEVTAVAH